MDIDIYIYIYMYIEREREREREREVRGLDPSVLSGTSGLLKLKCLSSWHLHVCHFTNIFIFFFEIFFVDVVE